MKDNISPEEKLLRLIKGESKQKSAAAIPSPEPIEEKEPTLVINENRPRVKNQLYVPAGKYLNAGKLQKLMFVLLGISVLYLSVSIIYPLVALKNIKLPDISKQTVEKPQEEPKEEARPFEFYSQGITQRQVFGAPLTGTQKPLLSAGAIDAHSIKDISLVGIISGENPQAVIEDKKNNKTYYLTKGQSIGDYQIEDIQEGKIILNYNGQRYELYL